METHNTTHTVDGLLISRHEPLGLVVSASEHNYMAGKWEAEKQELVAQLATARQELDALKHYVGSETLRSDFQTAGDMRNALTAAQKELAMAKDVIAANDKWHLEHRGNPFALQSALAQKEKDGEDTARLDWLDSISIEASVAVMESQSALKLPTIRKAIDAARSEGDKA